jgi:hypothetical protein
MEIKNNCPHCQQPLRFEDDQIGTTVECPGCHKDIQLYAPKHTMPKSAGIASSSRAGQSLVENHLESIGNIYLLLGIVAALLYVGIFIMTIVKNDPGDLPQFNLLLIGIGCFAQAWIIRTLFCGLAEIIRQLRALNQK